MLDRPSVEGATYRRISDEQHRANGLPDPDPPGAGG
jgi:hypothetical protein